MEDEMKITRLELIETRQKINLARKGHELLRQKRDILIAEFFRIMKEAKDIRGELDRKAAESYSALAKATMNEGSLELEAASLSVIENSNLSVGERNIMGVKIAEISKADFIRKPSERGYSLMSTSARLDECAQRFEEYLQLSIELAKTENIMKRLIREIEKTKRRVNALEFILIPSMQRKVAYISFRLDEIEREQFVSLKAIKERLG
ncbi:MAG: V-type ATP synthase subunit D [Candidatus Diapherotrites archaeon]